MMRPDRGHSKSWVPAEGLAHIKHNQFALPIANKKFGLRVFLAVVTSLFLLLVVSYSVRMGFVDWRSLPRLNLLWLNTAALVLSCIALQFARTSADKNRNRIKLGLLLAGLFAWIFLIGQVMVWKQLNEMGLYLETNPANSFFYLITAIHGLHLLGGLLVWSKTSFKLVRNKPVEDLSLSVELLAMYWHFLLAIWLIMFAMMLMK